MIEQAGGAGERRARAADNELAAWESFWSCVYQISGNLSNSHCGFFLEMIWFSQKKGYNFGHVKLTSFDNRYVSTAARKQPDQDGFGCFFYLLKDDGLSTRSIQTQIYLHCEVRPR